MTKFHSYSIKIFALLVFLTSLTILNSEQNLSGSDINYIEKLSKIKNINTIESFNLFKKNDMRVILVGINDYSRTEDFEDLSYCIDDIVVYEKIFNICAKVPSSEIIKLENVNRDDFITQFKANTFKMDQQKGFILVFSGHGTQEGGLVFSDGEVLSPKSLKELTNSFNNDTVLILDACYSGNNDGPIDLELKDSFRDNVQRIYASLAHLTAKEINYDDNKYFKPVSIFLNQTLGLDSVNGGGYFTALLSYFFTEYNFESVQNVSFKDLYTYIVNKGNSYIEFTAIRGVISAENSAYGESLKRMNQLPKILPLDKKVNFNNINNEFFLIKKHIRSVGYEFEFNSSPTIGLTSIYLAKPGFHSSLRGIYAPDYMKGFYFGFDVGYTGNFRAENIQLNEQGIFIHSVGFYSVNGFKFELVKNRFGFRLEANPGLSVNIWDFAEYKSVTRELINTVNFSFEGGAGLIFSPAKNLYLSLDVKVGITPIQNDLILVHLKFPIGISRRF